MDEGTAVLLYMKDKTEPDEMEGKVIVPDLKGLTVMEAAQMLQDCKLRLGIQGQGVAVYQSPAADDIVDEGTQVMVEFSAPDG